MQGWNQDLQNRAKLPVTGAIAGPSCNVFVFFDQVLMYSNQSTGSSSLKIYNFQNKYFRKKLHNVYLIKVGQIIVTTKTWECPSCCSSNTKRSYHKSFIQMVVPCSVTIDKHRIWITEYNDIRLYLVYDKFYQMHLSLSKQKVPSAAFYVHPSCKFSPDPFDNRFIFIFSYPSFHQDI